MRRFSSLKLSILSALLLTAISANVYAGDLKEPKSGKTFKDTIEVWGKSWVATGTGIRIKSVVGIKAQVYAAALYLEKDAAATALAAWKGSTTAADDAKLFKAIIDCDCGRGVELTFLRDIEGPKAKDAFIESAGIELKALYGISADDASVKDDMAKLGEFLNYNVKENNKLKFYFSKKGSISATGVGGTLTIKNSKIGKALLASWLGSSSRFTEDATLVTLKKGLVSNLSAIY
jgi:Chalcone isomerase-like